MMERQEVLDIVPEDRRAGRRPDLRGAILRKVNLRWFDLCESNLRGSDLRWANLYGAYLRGSDLRWANLYGACLASASLDGANLRGAYGILAIGPGGSRDDFIYAVDHGDTVMVQAGCRWCTVEEFAQAVAETYPDGQYRRYYDGVVAMIEAWHGHEEA